MTNAFETAAKSIAQEAVKQAIAKLAERDGFDPTEALAFVMGEVVKIKKEPIPFTALPWCGKVLPHKCDGLAYRGGLYVQCPQDKVNGRWCKKCARQVEENGTPTNGDVDQRKEFGLMSFKIGNRPVVPYGDFMKRHKYTREQVEESAALNGVTIDPVQYECKPRGRPKTNLPNMSTPLQELPKAPGAPKAESPKAESPKEELPKSPKAELPISPALPISALEESVESPKKSLPSLELPSSDEKEKEDIDTPPFRAPKANRAFKELEEGELEEEEIDEDDEIDEPEAKPEYTAKYIDDLLIGELRTFAEKNKIATKENGKNIPPKQLRSIVRTHFNV